jgi:hypothetical protein
LINDDVYMEQETATGWFGDEFNPVWDPDGCVYIKPKCGLNDPPCEYDVTYISCRQARTPEIPFNCPPPP